MASEKEHITIEQAGVAFRAIQRSKDGRTFTEWLFRELGYGQSLANSDPRKEAGNVALHDFAVELDRMLK